MAGAVSRSLTAPLDRLKIMLQVRELRLLKASPLVGKYYHKTSSMRTSPLILTVACSRSTGRPVIWELSQDSSRWSKKVD